MNDNLNFHNEKTLFVLRKDGHYDIIYHEFFLDPDFKVLMKCDEQFNKKIKEIDFLKG